MRDLPVPCTLNHLHMHEEVGRGHASDCDRTERRSIVVTPGADLNPKASAMAPHSLNLFAACLRLCNLQLHSVRICHKITVP